MAGSSTVFLTLFGPKLQALDRPFFGIPIYQQLHEKEQRPMDPLWTMDPPQIATRSRDQVHRFLDASEVILSSPLFKLRGTDGGWEGQSLGG